MEIHVKDSTIVRPAEETPKHRLFLSNIDRSRTTGHVPTVYFYRRPNSDDESQLNFFEAGVLKEGLSKVLVPFYPVAGRLTKDENGRHEIDCNAEGVLFMEAETNCVIDDFGDFTPSSELSQLLPKLEYGNHVSSSPLLVVQCGGVCLGIGLHHALADGTSGIHLINSWAEVTRGSSISIPPFLDRTVLHAMTAPYPTFDHIEYHASPSLINQELQSSPKPTSTSVVSVKISRDQINTLKVKINKDHGATYTTYEILAAHIWRCTCKVRGLSNEQPTRLQIAVDGRSRLNPPLPRGYFGNVNFHASVIILAGEIQSQPLIFTIKKIHEAIKRRDDEYLRSALAYLEKNHDEITQRQHQRGHSCNSPNLKITSWTRMPIYGGDFGWGEPMFVGRAIVPNEGAAYILQDSSTDGSLSLIQCLETHQIEIFKRFFYDFCDLS